MGIGKRIREARIRKNLTQIELAKKLGLSKGAIANYENDISHPKEPVMYALLDALDVEPNFLFQDCVKNSPVNKNYSAPANGLTPQEAEIALAYRKASADAKLIVETALKPYMEQEPKIEDGIGNLAIG